MLKLRNRNRDGHCTEEEVTISGNDGDVYIRYPRSDDYAPRKEQRRSQGFVTTIKTLPNGRESVMLRSPAGNDTNIITHECIIHIICTRWNREALLYRLKMVPAHIDSNLGPAHGTDENHCWDCRRRTRLESNQGICLCPLVIPETMKTTLRMIEHCVKNTSNAERPSKLGFQNRNISVSSSDTVNCNTKIEIVESEEFTTPELANLHYCVKAEKTTISSSPPLSDTSGKYSHGALYLCCAITIF